MPKLIYEVLEGETVNHDGTEYSGGETLELEEEQAKRLVELKIIKQIGTPTPQKPPGGTKKTPGGEMAPPTGGVPKPVHEAGEK